MDANSGGYSEVVSPLLKTFKTRSVDLESTAAVFAICSSKISSIGFPAPARDINPEAPASKAKSPTKLPWLCPATIMVSNFDLKKPITDLASITKSSNDIFLSMF